MHAPLALLLFVSLAAAFLFSVGILSGLFAGAKQRRLSSGAVGMSPYILFSGFAAKAAPTSTPHRFQENE
jgi:hypothetical protein